MGRLFLFFMMVITDCITQGKYSKGITQYCQQPLDGQHGNHLPLSDSVAGFYVNRGSQCLWNKFRRQPPTVSSDSALGMVLYHKLNFQTRII